MQHPTFLIAPDNEVLIKIAELFRERSGWKISGRDLPKFQKAVGERMSCHKITQMTHYYQKLLLSHTGHGDEFLQLAALIINPETYFFRDKGHQDALRTNILPNLIKLRSDAKQLRIWSAGCSTGEEAYSIAILLKSLLPQRPSWKVTIIGTDLCRESIQKAQKGVYKENSLRDINPSERLRYFNKIGNEWQLNSEYRCMVKFVQGNLVEDVFPSSVTELRHMDLIICQNVFIYFNPAAIDKVIQKFIKTLQPGGILLLGHGEAQIAKMQGLKSELIPGALIHKKL